MAKCLWPFCLDKSLHRVFSGQTRKCIPPRAGQGVCSLLMASDAATGTAICRWFKVTRVHFLVCPTTGGKTGQPKPALLYFSGWLSMGFGNKQRLRVHRTKPSTLGWSVVVDLYKLVTPPIFTTNLKTTVHQI